MYKRIRKHRKENKTNMESFKEKLKGILLRLRGEDNYLTTETVTIGLITIVFIIAIVVMVLFPRSRFNPKNLIGNNNLIKTSPTPTPTPIPLPRGPREFGVSNSMNPQIREFKISEFAPKKGERQEITVRVVDGKKQKITDVLLNLRSDNKTKNLSLKLASGTEVDGEWRTSWIVDDSFDYVYSLEFKAKNEKGEEAVVTPTFR